jgi:AAA+ ATPase superfamily predicted ATPase
MRNVIGPSVEGEDFFPRKAVIKQIYRALDSTAHIFLSAPRRVGKTSIMLYLEKNPTKDYEFVYIITESVDSVENYFKKLIEELLKSDAVNNMVKTSEKAKSIFGKLAETIKSFKAFGLEIEIDSKKEVISYEQEFRNLMQRLDDSDLTIVVMVDEFPNTIKKILKSKGMNEAVRFLQINREIRQEGTGNIRFIYTGSVGLRVLVQMMKHDETINDLKEEHVEPLSFEEGKELAAMLFTSAKVVYEEDVLDYIIGKIRWLMPFYIQMTVSELIKIYDKTEKAVSKTDVDTAFVEMMSYRNHIQFNSYYNRLHEAFIDDESHEIALKALRTVAILEVAMSEDMFGKIKHEKQKAIIRNTVAALEEGGYIFEENGKYRFNSPILRNWWLKNIA